MTTVNLLGIAEHARLGESPYRVDRDGAPYVPAGDGGIVLDFQLGDPVFSLHADHAAPGACLVHPDPAARHALTTFACIGNPALVRTGPAAGAQGVVLGKRGEEGRVVVALQPQQLALLRPGDEVLVRSSGQGWRPPRLDSEIAVGNIAPATFAALPADLADGGAAAIAVRAAVPSKLAGNGIGRPAVSWDLDLQLTEPPDGGQLLLGDLVAVTDLDARYNMGYRRGFVTIGMVVHGGSPLPGHGPGITPILSGPSAVVTADVTSEGRAGLTLEALQLQ